MWKLLPLLIASPLAADPPEILNVQVSETSVAVTLAHPDTGWDHYADGWRIEDENGNVLGTRVLAHPHVAEQPFTRSLTISDLPDQVFIRARCIVDGWNETTVAVQVR